MELDTIITSLLGSGGGAWLAIKFKFAMLEKGVEEAKAAAKAAHQRIDTILTGGNR